MKEAAGTILFSLVVPGTVAFLVPQWIGAAINWRVALDQGKLEYLGYLLILIGVIIYSWSAARFVVEGRGTPIPLAAPENFVAVGPYRYVRNPMYLGVLTVVFGQALLRQSPAVLLYGFLLFGMFHLFVVWYEEPNLQRRFGESYRSYLLHVHRWWPSRPSRTE